MFRRTHVIICAICLGIGFLGSLLPDAEEQLGLHLLYRLRVPEKPRTGVIVMAISRMTIEKRVSAVPLLADAAIAQTPFPLPKVPIKLNQYWRFGPDTTEQPTLPVVVMHSFAKAVFSDFIALLRKTDPQAASKLPALSRSESTVQDVIKAILPTYHLFQRHPSLADRMAAVLRHDSRGSPLSPTHRQVSAFIDLYSAGSSSYLNFYRPPGTVETVSYHE
jgi:adenylate cyclase